VAEAALFPEKEYIKGIFVAVWEHMTTVKKKFKKKYTGHTVNSTGTPARGGKQKIRKPEKSRQTTKK
jgi:hypothetical protein